MRILLNRAYKILNDNNSNNAINIYYKNQMSDNITNEKSLKTSKNKSNPF